MFRMFDCLCGVESVSCIAGIAFMRLFQNWQYFEVDRGWVVGI